MNGAQTSEQVRISGKLVNINALTRDQLDDYTAMRFERIQRKMLNTLKIADFSKVPVNQLAVALGIVTDKARLIRGQSTSNTAVSGRVDAIHRVQVLSGRLEQALHGRDGSSKMLIQASEPDPNKGNYSIPASNVESIDAQVVECEELATPARHPGYSVHGKRMGRPRKSQQETPP